MRWRHCLSRTLWQCRLWGQAQNIWPGSKNQNSPENYTPYSGHSSRSHKLTQIPNPKCLMYSKNQNSLKNNPPLPGPNSEPKIFNKDPKMNYEPKTTTWLKCNHKAFNIGIQPSLRRQCCRFYFYIWDSHSRYFCVWPSAWVNRYFRIDKLQTHLLCHRLLFKSHSKLTAKYFDSLGTSNCFKESKKR